MTKRYLTILFVLIASSAYTHSDDSVRPFTLPDAIRHGLTNSPSAENAALELDIAETLIGQAKSLGLPQLSLGANYTRLDEVTEIDLGEGAFELGSLDNYEVSAGVSQLLYSGGQLGAAWRAAKLSREYAAIRKTAFESSLVFNITREFHAAVLAREALLVEEASLQMLQDFEQQIRERERSGSASEFDALSAQVRVANAKPAWIAARNQLALARSALATRINFKGDVNIQGDFDFEDISWELADLQQIARQNRQELMAARLLADLSKEAIASARSQARPEIRLFANSIGGNANQFAFSDEWEWRWNAGVTARWNLWDGDLTRQTVRQRKIEYRQQQNTTTDLEAAVMLEVQQAWLALVQAREARAASAESVNLAERALAIAKVRYDAGLSTYLELTDANVALRTAELTRLKARHDHAVALAQLYYATGIPSPHRPADFTPDHNPNHQTEALHETE
ncbi:MAG: TolC family protein [Kiritimatiellia bacterium]